MIEIYIKTNTDYTKNGNITLKPTTCTYKDSENELYIEHFLDQEGRWEFIQYENVVAIQREGKKILYRIYNVIKSLYKVVAYARPIFYDLANTVLLDVRPTNKNGNDALADILANTGFTGHSDIPTINTSYLVRKNVVEALLGDDDNSFINRWGGEFYCENFDVYINNRIGSNRGVRVEFGYNLNEIEEEVNIEEVVTRIIPVGYEGIMLEGNAPWVSSPLVNNYTHPRMKVIEFSDVKVQNETSTDGFATIDEARAELIKRCEALFAAGIDKPTVNYKIDMINLSNTTYYKDFKDLLKVSKGDTVTCYVPYLDINVEARVIDFERDELTGEYISIELGNAVNNYVMDQVNIQHRINNVLNDKGQVKADTLNGTINALNTQFKALRDVAQPQEVLGMLFEDRVQDSPTFGCLAIGTMGFMISNKYKPGTTEWDFRTFGTGAGFTADLMTTGTMLADRVRAGLLESQNKNTWINLNDGTFSFGNKINFDGNNVTYDFTGTNVAMQDDINTAKNEINQTLTTTANDLRSQFQNAKVTVNGQGITIADGAFVLKNTAGTVIIDGTSKIHKIVKEGNITLQYRGVSTSVTVPHNLGYKPAFSSYQQQGQEFTQIPAFTWSDNSGVSAIIRARADQNNLYFDFVKLSSASISNTDIQIKYYIYNDVAF